MRKKIRTALLVFLMFLGGCGTLQKNPSEHLRQDVATVTQVIGNSADSIYTSTENINKNVIDIKQTSKEVKVQAPDTAPLMNNIEKSADNISSESRKLKETSLNLSKAGVKLEISGRTIDGYVNRALDAEAENEDLTAKVTKLEEDAKAGLHRILKWIIVACVVGAGGLGVFGLMYSSKMCLTLSAVCVVVMTMAIFVETAFLYLVICGGLLFLALIGFLIYNIVVKNKAFSQIIDTVEVVKFNLSSDKKEEIFGKDGEIGLMNTIQSKNTIDLVRKEKAKLSNLWNYAKNK